MKFINISDLTQLEKKIIDIALKEFESKGYFQASVDSIAEKAGIGKGTVYRHFGKKLSLFFHVVMNVMTEMENDFQEVRRIPDFMGALNAYIESALKFHVSKGAFMRSITSEEKLLYLKNEFEKSMDLKVLFKMVIESRERMISVLRDILVKGKDEKIIYADIDENIMSEIVYMIINQFLRASCNISYVKSSIGLTMKFSQPDGMKELKKLILRGLGISNKVLEGK